MKNSDELILTPHYRKWSIKGVKEQSTVLLEGFIFDIKYNRKTKVLYIYVIAKTGYIRTIVLNMNKDHYVIDLLEKIDYTRCLTIRPTIIEEVNTINIDYSDEYDLFWSITNGANIVKNSLFKSNIKVEKEPTKIRESKKRFEKMVDVVKEIKKIDIYHVYWKKNI